MKRNILKALERIFFPNTCPICGKVIKPKGKICKECIEKVNIVQEPKCQKCGKQLGTDEKLFCTDCSNTKHIFDRGVCIFEYTDEIKKSLYEFKYGNKRCYNDLFGYTGAVKYRKLFNEWKADVILPVPMYYKKQRKRGYNQAEEFGKSLSEYTGIEIDCKSLVRMKDTKPQKGLNKEERYTNLQNAIAVDRERIKGKTSVLLVDDIYTTGSTLDACAEVLKKAGIEKVYFMCVAGGRDTKKFKEKQQGAFY